MYGISFMTFRSVPKFPPGILVRNDAARDRLQQKLQNSIIMSGPTFSRQVFS